MTSLRVSIVAATALIFFDLANAKSARASEMPAASPFLERIPCESGEPPNFQR